MIRFVEHPQIDARKWDETVRNARFSTVFCTYNMLDLLTRGSVWHALIEDDYTAIMPLPSRKKFGFPYVYSPFFMPQMGILSTTETTPEMLASFIDAIPKKYLQTDILLNMVTPKTLPDNHIIHLASHQLNLNAPYETLFSRFSKNTQRNINASKKQNLTLVDSGVSVDEVIELFVKNRGKAQNVRFREPDYAVLRQCAQQLISQGRLTVPGVRDSEGHLIAGALMVKDFQRHWFWFSGRDNRYAAQKPMFFLLDAYIQQHCGQPVLLDFNGSIQENVARFYRGFGGVRYDIPMVQHTRSSIWRLPYAIYKKFRAL